MQWNQVKSFKFDFFYDFVTKVKAFVSDHPVKNVWSQNWSIEIRFSSHLCYIWKKINAFKGWNIRSILTAKVSKEVF